VVADRRAPVLPTAELTDAALVPRSVRLYLVSFLIVGMAMSVLGPALTDLREKSGADIGDIGILFVGQSAGYIIGSFTGGRMFDRFNSHRVFALSLVLLGAGLALVPSFSALGALFATFVLIGFGGSICDLGGNTLLMWGFDLVTANVNQPPCCPNCKADRRRLTSDLLV